MLRRNVCTREKGVKRWPEKIRIAGEGGPNSQLPRHRSDSARLSVLSGSGIPLIHPVRSTDILREGRKRAADMGRKSDAKGMGLIERKEPRALFAELVAGAVEENRVAASPLAITYLVELLDSRVRLPDAAADAPGEESTLAESLLRARQEQGAARVRRLRSLGDRALFVAGYFGDSLQRSLVDIDYYGDIGRAAYSNLAASLSDRSREPTWRGLYTELAQRFDRFVDVLAEVGDRTRSSRGVDLLRLYERCVRTGSPRDRRRLLRRGYLPPAGGSTRIQ